MEKLRIIVPSYNEESSIVDFYNEVEKYINKNTISSDYLFVDDGSKDKTLDTIKGLREKDKRVNYISLSRNSGKEAAMLAGLEASKDMDMVIIIDADLQHPPYLIEEMIKKHSEGYKIVYTKQASRKDEGFVRKAWAKAFYSFFNKHADTRMDQSTKDYMLLDKIALDAFLALPDEYRFTKGILSFVGFKRCALEFDYVEREKGVSKWNFKKLLSYGVNGLNQFSSIFLIVPKFVAIFSFLVAVASIFVYAFTKIFSLEAFILLLSISILFMLTNISLYFLMFTLYSTRREVIKRPLYFIEESSLDA